MVMLVHPLSNTEYHRNTDGTVRVVGKNGVEGLFTRDGEWISGERKTADAAMCQWISDACLGSSARLRKSMSPKVTEIDARG